MNAEPQLKVNAPVQELLALVCRYGVSRRLFEDFLRPLLLVGLFAPAEELSAAVMIGTLYFYGMSTHVSRFSYYYTHFDGCKQFLLSSS